MNKEAKQDGDYVSYGKQSSLVQAGRRELGLPEYKRRSSLHFALVANRIPAKKPGESTLHGPRVNDKDNDETIEHKGRRVVFSPEKQPSKGKNEPLLPHKTNERKIGKNWYVT